MKKWSVGYFTKSGYQPIVRNIPTEELARCLFKGVIAKTATIRRVATMASYIEKTA